MESAQLDIRERGGGGIGGSRPELTGAALHVLAMALMLLDHIWGSFPGTGGWMTCAGRLTFPIFAFLLSEGFRRTHDLKRYALRLFVFAVISEVPFDLMYEGTAFDPSHQNVLWTFLIALGGMSVMERAKKLKKRWLTILADAAVFVVTYVLAIIAFTDYNGPGVLTVYVFYFLRKRRWWCFAGQLLLLLYINTAMIRGYFYPVAIGPVSLELPRQALAVLALLPIWLYRGRQGHHSKAFQYFCYGFYPAHTLILYLAASFLIV